MLLKMNQLQPVILTLQTQHTVKTENTNLCYKLLTMAGKQTQNDLRRIFCFLYICFFEQKLI